MRKQFQSSFNLSIKRILNPLRDFLRKHCAEHFVLTVAWVQLCLFLGNLFRELVRKPKWYRSQISNRLSRVSSTEGVHRLFYDSTTKRSPQPTALVRRQRLLTVLPSLA